VEWGSSHTNYKVEERMKTKRPLRIQTNRKYVISPELLRGESITYIPYYYPPKEETVVGKAPKMTLKEKS